MAAVTQAQTVGDIQVAENGKLIISQEIRISVAEIKTRPFKAASPYVGLTRFEERHKDFFLGRDDLIDKLREMVAVKNIVLVTG